MPRNELNDFLKEMKISKETFDKSKLSWKTLKKIKTEYERNLKDYEEIALRYVEQLSKIESVHSVRYRIKNPYHLLEKIIRKTNEGEQITEKNYTSCIPDIIGIRALYIFKSDWIRLHEDIKQKYGSMFTQKPEIQLKKGDDDNPYKDIRNIEIKENKDYRSIHYVIRHEAFDPTNGNKKLEVRVEVQTRSIFEEGWSEINHKLLYKKELASDVRKHSASLSSILSGLVGECDQLGEEIRRYTDTKKVPTQVSAKEKISPDLQDSKITGSDIVDIMEQFLDEGNL